MGPTNSHKAREEAPNSIRALFGADNQCNATHGSDSEYSAQRELSQIFGGSSSSGSSGNNNRERTCLELSAGDRIQEVGWVR